MTTTCSPPGTGVATPPATASPATRRRRAARPAGTLLATSAGRRPAGTLLATSAGRRHTRRTAARLLTAAGVRVRVVPSPVAWPRPADGLLVVVDRLSWLDELALRTVLHPGSPVVRPGTATGSATGPGRSGPAAVLCPVAVRHTVAGWPATTAAAPPGEPWWRCLARVLAVDGLVVEVHLLAPVDPRAAGLSPRTPAPR